MTVTVAPAGADVGGIDEGGGAPPAHRWRRRIIVGVAALVAMALLAAGIGWASYVHAYQPLGPGDVGHGPSGDLKPITDGVNDTYLIETGPQGSSGLIAQSVANYGSHPVTITGVVGDPTVPVTWRWVRMAIPNQLPNLPPVSDTHLFPAVLGAGKQIMVYVIVHRPRCRRKEIEEIGDIPLAWHALGDHHVYTIGFGANQPILPILACYPPAATRHIAKSLT